MRNVNTFFRVHFFFETPSRNKNSTGKKIFKQENLYCIENIKNLLIMITTSSIIREEEKYFNFEEDIQFFTSMIKKGRTNMYIKTSINFWSIV